MVRRGVGDGCQSGWGRLLSVTNRVGAGSCGRGESGWAIGQGLGGRGGGGVPPPLPMHPCPPHPPGGQGDCARGQTADGGGGNEQQIQDSHTPP